MSTALLENREAETAIYTRESTRCSPCLTRRDPSAEETSSAACHRHMDGRTVTVALKSTDLPASLLSLHQMQWSTGGGAFMADDHRIRPNDRSRIRRGRPGFYL